MKYGREGLESQQLLRCLGDPNLSQYLDQDLLKLFPTLVNLIACERGRNLGPGGCPCQEGWEGSRDGSLCPNSAHAVPGSAAMAQKSPMAQIPPCCHTMMSLMASAPPEVGGTEAPFHFHVGPRGLGDPSPTQCC